MVQVLEVVLHLSLKFILTFKNVFKAIVLVNWVLFLYYLQQMVLLIYDIFNFLCFEIFVELSFEKMSSEFLGVLFEFVFVLFDFSH